MSVYDMSVSSTLTLFRDRGAGVWVGSDTSGSSILARLMRLDDGWTGLLFEALLGVFARPLFVAFRFLVVVVAVVGTEDVSGVF